VFLRGRFDSFVGEDASSSKRRFTREVVGVVLSSACFVQARFQMSHMTLEKRISLEESKAERQREQVSIATIGLKKTAA